MRISVVAHPNAKRPRIETDLFGTLHVYVSTPPLEGRANQALVEALAEHFHVKKNEILLMKGEKGKIKIFEIKKLKSGSVP